MGIVIVGAGQAGAWVARSLRETGFDGAITLLGNEKHLPYERPPLSKAGLADNEGGYVPVFSKDDYTNLDINLVLGKRAISVNRAEQYVICDDGSWFRYDKLALTTGGRARIPPIPGNDLPGVLTLRTIEDATAISQGMQAGARIVVIGGGWIGLEVAAMARGRGLDVTVVETGDRLCARALPPSMSAYVLGKHRSNDVEVLLRTSVEQLHRAEDGRLIVTTASTGEKLAPADLVVLGVGIEPNTELASMAGLIVEDGIVVDEYGVTSDPNIFAAGDVARLPCPWGDGRRMRLESWANAQNHGIAVGRALAGCMVPYDDLPWFWSDQYDANIQMAGLFVPEAVEVVRGGADTDSFTLFQVCDRRVIAAASVNAARDMRFAKQLIKTARQVDPMTLADPMIRLDKLPDIGE
jgi:3-phenylpropionate/trans-cinnamate dioxygenase ferredoxin reductase subunit